MRRGITILLATLVVSSCGIFKPKVVHDVYTEIKYVYKDSIAYRDSLIKIPIPLEKDQVITHLGDTSRLETSVAQSVAFIGTDGFLHHSLENKKGALETTVKIPSRMILTNVSSNKSESLTKIEYKEKPLSKWKQLKLDALWWLVLSLLLSLMWIFRKPISKLIKI